MASSLSSPILSNCLFSLYLTSDLPSLGLMAQRGGAAQHLLFVDIFSQLLICLESAFDVFKHLVSADAYAFLSVIDEHSVGDEFKLADGADFDRYAVFVVDGGVLV